MLIILKPPRPDEFFDFLPDRSPHASDRPQFFFFHQICKILFQEFEVPRHRFIGTGLEGILTIQLQHQDNLIKDIDYFIGCNYNHN